MEAGWTGASTNIKQLPMAIGLPPAHRHIINMEGFSRAAALALAAESLSDCYWPLVDSNAEQLTAQTLGSLFWKKSRVQVQWEANRLIVKSTSAHRFFMDFGANRHNERTFCRVLETLKTQFLPGYWDQKYEALEAGFTDEPPQSPLNTPWNERVHSVLSFFLPQRDYWATLLLAACNLLVFAGMVCYGMNPLIATPNILIDWGANYYPALLNGAWWRLLTGCFIHAHILHLLCNIGSLIFIGFVVEPCLGSFRFLAFYLIVGILASLTSMYWHPTLVCVGASGAIFGLCGLLLVLLAAHVIAPKNRRPLLVVALIFIAVNLLSGMAIANIDNAAHLGGLVSGITIGAFVLPRNKKEHARGKGYAVAALGILVLAAMSFCYRHQSFNGFRKYAASWQLFRGMNPAAVLPPYYRSLPPSFTRYRQGIKEAAILESMALEVYQMPAYAPAETVLYQLKGRGIYYWQETIRQLNRLDTLSLPETYHRRNNALIHYCRLRINDYGLLYKTLKEHTNGYRDSLQFYHQAITAFINELK